MLETERRLSWGVNMARFQPKNQPHDDVSHKATKIIKPFESLSCDLRAEQKWLGEGQ